MNKFGLSQYGIGLLAGTLVSHYITPGGWIGSLIAGIIFAVGFFYKDFIA